MESGPQFLEVDSGEDRRRITYRAEVPSEAGSPRATLLWLSGFKSDMASTKATALAAWARERGFGCVRFDYSGHGLSDGRFEDGTIGRWLDEAAAVCMGVALNQSYAIAPSARRPSDASEVVCPPTPNPSPQGGGEFPLDSHDAVPPPLWGRIGGGESRTPRSTVNSLTPLILVGSSMGAYIALLLLRRLRESAPEDAARIAGLVLIAPAWDMTERLLWNAMTEEDRARLMTEGVYPLPSPYGEPTPITRTLIEEGRRHLLAERPFNPGCPVCVLQGLRDEDVPPDHARRLARVLFGDWVEITEIVGGDHRLSRPEDLDLLFQAIERVARGCARSEAP